MTCPVAWPFLSVQRLQHVGAFDPALKGSTHNRQSLEGPGLSVSLDPGAWRRIARLGGPTWDVCRCDGAPMLLLDVRSLTSDQLDRVTEWAIAEGLIVMHSMVEVSWYDDEVGDRLRMAFDCTKDPAARERARLELEDREAMEAEWTELLAPAATANLDARVGYPVPPGLARDMALSAFATDCLAQEVDGLWWADRLDPAALSAPRGVIFSRALLGLSVTPAVSELSFDYDDDDALTDASWAERPGHR